MVAVLVALVVRRLVVALLALLWALPSAAQDPPFQQLDANTGATTNARVFVGLFAPSASGAVAVALPTTLGAGGGFRVDCMAGCTAAASFEDNDAFTVGTTAVNVFAGLFDDVAPTAATENSAAAVRMSANRNFYAQLRDAAGNERGVNVNASNELTIADATAQAYLQLVAGASEVAAMALTGTQVLMVGGTDGTNGQRAEIVTTQADNIVNTRDGFLTSSFTYIFDGAAWDRWTGAVTATNLDVQSGGADLATETTAAAILTSTNFAAAFGTAGAADAQVMSVQGIASGTAVTVTATNLDVQIGGSDTLTIGTFPDNEPVNVALVGGAAINLGSGTIGTGTTRVTIATDDPVNDAAVETSAAIGATAAAVPASATQIGGTDGTNLTVPYIDPCQREARTQFVVDIVTATTTEIANQVASEFFYVCSLSFFSAGTNNVAIVEDDTDACASPTAGLNGGVTAAEGYNFVAQTGIALGDGSHWIMKTGTANRYWCIITSANVQLSGTISYVSAP